MSVDDTNLYDVLIKTVVNVKFRKVPAPTPAAALERAEQSTDFNRLFRERRTEPLSYDKLPVFPSVAYTEWAEESIEALVDTLDPETDDDFNEDKSVYYEMRLDPEKVDDIRWRESENAANAFLQKLRELRERESREAETDEPAFDGNDAEIAFLRELIDLAARTAMR